jgi:hypothetical protein
VPGENYLGGSAMSDPSGQGWVTAVDAASDAVRWITAFTLNDAR